MASSRPSTAFGDKIAQVKNDLVNMSQGGTLTRVFDSIPNREEDVHYVRTEMSKIFAEQMTGQKPIDVTIKNIGDLQKIINNCAQAVILNDSVIQEALLAIGDNDQRQQCQRDIVVAYANKLTAKVNTDARMGANIPRGSEQERNVKGYMEFVRCVQNLHDQLPNVALMDIRNNAKGVLAEVLQSSRAALLLKKVDLSSSDENVADAARASLRSGSPSLSPIIDRRKEREQYLKSRVSSSRTVLTPSTSAAAATPAATATSAAVAPLEPQQLQDEQRPMEKKRAATPPPRFRGGS